jgi:ribonuclease HI
VDRKIDTKGGAPGFVDSFSAWVKGVDEEETPKLIQEEIIPHAGRWARESRASFEADKTSLIHFTKRVQRDDSRPMWFDGNEIYPQQSIKVLRLIPNKKLGMDEHIARVVRKGTKACLSLQTIKCMRRIQLRQLYRVCVTPVLDYAASAWYGPGKVGVLRLTYALDKVQRLGARMILGAWKSVALPILEAEACLEPTAERILRKVTKHAVKVLTLPTDNPTRQAIPRTMNVARQVSPLNATIAACKERVKPSDSVLPLGSPAWTQPPWIDQSRRVVIRSREEAVRETGTAAAALTMCLYTDASVGKKLVAIAVVQRVGIETRVLRQEVIGWAKTCSVLAAELAAIAIALDHADRHFHRTQIVLFSDSQRALRAIQIGEVSGSKRTLLYRILQAMASLTKKNTDVRLRWMPAHEGIVGNEEADEAARAASCQKGKPSAPALERVREVEGVIRLIDRDRSDNPTPFDSTGLAGQYTWKMDQALPGKHTLRLYGALTSDQAATLIQARTRHCRLNRYLARIGLVESILRECERGEETIRHVILSCARWAEERKALWTVAKQRAGDVPFLLGGWGKKQDSQGQLVDGPKEKWRPDLEVVKATIRFLEQTGRLDYRRQVGQA